MIRKFIAIVAISCIAGNAQQYFEASDSTRVFTLTAGAKAGPSAVLATNRGADHDAHLVITVRRGVYISAPGASAGAQVGIYNIMGIRVEQIAIENGVVIPVTKSLPDGIYFARLEMNHRPLSALCFRVVR
jgi:hypothetical protein